MELITVTCSRDKEQMLLQANSIDLYVNPPCIHHIIIEDNNMIINEWKNLLDPFYKRHKLNIISSEEFIDPTLENGWIRQQVLKLYATKLVNDTHILCLDTKNIFINQINLDQWPIDHGNNRSTLVTSLKYSIKYREWLDRIKEITKLNIDLKYINSTTPYKMKKVITNKILELDLKNIFFSNLNLVSEFMLYQIISESIKEPMSTGNDIDVTLWKKEDIQGLKYLLPETIVLGIHYDLLLDIDNKDWEILKKFLIKKQFDNLVIKQLYEKFNIQKYIL